MNEILMECTYFGAALTLACYLAGVWLQKRFPRPIVNPLLIGSALVMAFLVFFHIDYDTYDEGAKYITYFMTPATVCLAIPMYKQMQILKKNAAAVFLGILSGCIAHAFTILAFVAVFSLDKKITISLLPKSVTTPIAVGICTESGGITGLTVVGVVIAGLTGAILGPYLLKLFRIQDPIAQGLAIGTASHAVGTSKMVEYGEVQTAMSSLAIVVTGLLTVIIVPLVIPFLL